MKFLSIYTPDAKRADQRPSPENMAEMGKLVEDSMKSGELLATGGLLPIAKGGARVRASGSRITVLDGPFAESKEVVCGFALLEAKSREDAIDMCRRFLKIAGDGVSDLYAIMGPEDELRQN